MVYAVVYDTLTDYVVKLLRWYLSVFFQR